MLCFEHHKQIAIWFHYTVDMRDVIGADISKKTTTHTKIIWIKTKVLFYGHFTLLPLKFEFKYQCKCRDEDEFRSLRKADRDVCLCLHFFLKATKPATWFGWRWAVDCVLCEPLCKTSSWSTLSSLFVMQPMISVLSFVWAHIHKSLWCWCWFLGELSL